MKSKFSWQGLTSRGSGGFGCSVLTAFRICFTDTPVATVCKWKDYELSETAVAPTLTELTNNPLTFISQNICGGQIFGNRVW